MTRARESPSWPKRGDGGGRLAARPFHWIDEGDRIEQGHVLGEGVLETAQLDAYEQIVTHGARVEPGGQLELVTKKLLGVVEEGEGAGNVGARPGNVEGPENEGAVGVPLELGEVEAVPEGDRVRELALGIEPHAGDVLGRRVEGRLVGLRTRHRGEARARRPHEGKARVGGPLAAHVLVAEKKPRLPVGTPQEGGVHCPDLPARKIAIVVGSLKGPVEAEGHLAIGGRDVAVDGARIGPEAPVGERRLAEACRDRLFAHELHGPGQRVRAIEEARRPLQHLELPHVVHRIERGLGLGNPVVEDEAAGEGVEAAHREVVEDTEAGGNVDSAGVLEGVVQHERILVAHQAGRDHGEGEGKVLRGGGKARRRPGERRQRGQLGLDVYSLLQARRLVTGGLGILGLLLRRRQAGGKHDEDGAASEQTSFHGPGPHSWGVEL